MPGREKLPRPIVSEGFYGEISALTPTFVKAPADRQGKLTSKPGRFNHQPLHAVIPACPESDGHGATVKTDSGLASLARMTGIRGVILAFVDLACPADLFAEVLT